MDSASTWPWALQLAERPSLLQPLGGGAFLLNALVAGQPGAPLEAAGGRPKVPGRLAVEALRF